MNCEQAKIRLTDDFVAGALNYRKHSEINLHIQNCPACKKEYDYFTRIASDILALRETGKGIFKPKPVPKPIQKDINKVKASQFKLPSIARYTALLKQYKENIKTDIVRLLNKKIELPKIIKKTKNKQLVVRTSQSLVKEVLNRKKYNRIKTLILKYCIISASVLLVVVILYYAFKNTDFNKKIEGLKIKVVSIHESLNAAHNKKEQVNIIIKKEENSIYKKQAMKTAKNKPEPVLKKSISVKKNEIPPSKIKKQPQKSKVIQQKTAEKRIILIDDSDHLGGKKPITNNHQDKLSNELNQVDKNEGNLEDNKHIIILKVKF